MTEKKNEAAVFDSQVYHSCREFTDGISQTVNAQYGTGGNNQRLVVAPEEAVAIGNGQLNQIAMSDKANALDTMHDQQAILSYGLDRASYNQGKNAKFDISIEEEKIGAQTAKGPGAVLPKMQCTVRRLTPVECERLQGYPSGWSDVPGASDSKRYKALGNSIALPFWEFLAKRFVQIGNVESIGSLFDGIAGFPLVFHRAGAETKWTSEIEPFCEAVVKYHIDNGDL